MHRTFNATFRLLDNGCGDLPPCKTPTEVRVRQISLSRASKSDYSVHKLPAIRSKTQTLKIRKLTPERFEWKGNYRQSKTAILEKLERIDHVSGRNCRIRDHSDIGRQCVPDESLYVHEIIHVHTSMGSQGTSKEDTAAWATPDKQHVKVRCCREE
jgi:hypothetical protein